MNLRSFSHLLFLSSLIWVMGCKPWKQPSAHSNVVIQVGNGAEPASLDPQVVDGVPEMNILSALFEGLLVPDPETLKPSPGLAHSWSISSDGLRYIFNLRENLRWSNGDPFEAKDFVFSLRRALSPKLGSPWVSFYFCVQNAEAYFSGKIDDFDQVGIQAINEYCLEITLEHPVPYFLELLMHGAWYPVHEDTIEKFGDIDKRDTPWIKPGNMVCNGPFILKSWENDSHISVVKNPYYWDKGSIALERISFHPISDTAVEERMYASGDLDITYRVHVSKLEHYKKTGELYLSPYLGCMWVTMNCAKKPFDDIRVRKALALAINRKEIGKVRGIGDGFEAYGVVPPETLHYKQQPRLFEEDIQEAKRLLAEAGYPNAKGFPEVEVLYNTSDLHRSVFEALQAMWKKNLNIRINLLSQEWKVYLMLKKQGDFSLTRYAWIGDYNDPSSLMDIFQSDSPNNDSRWCSLRYDYLLFQAKTAINEEKRIKLLQEAERIFVQEMPAIPVYWETSSHLVSPHVKGWFPNVMDIHPWKCVSKVECK